MLLAGGARARIRPRTTKPTASGVCGVVGSASLPSSSWQVRCDRFEQAAVGVDRNAHPVAAIGLAFRRDAAADNAALGTATITAAEALTGQR